MALKKHRNFNKADWEVSFFMNETGEAGIIVAYPSASVAQPGLDDPNNAAVIPTSTGFTPVGILASNVVNKDLVKHHLNKHKPSEQQIGSKVQIFRKGWFITDQVATGVTIAVGEDAYFGSGGKLTNNAGSVKVGVFESVEDSNGFVRVRIDL